MSSKDALKIEIVGLKEWTKELKAVDKALVKELGQEYKKIGELIASGARSRAESLGGVAAHSVDAIKATARTTDVTIRLDGDRFPWALGAEFGGGPPNTPQFQPWRGSGPDAGYFLYPTIRDNSQTILTAFDDVVDRVTKHAFPD